MRSLLHDLQVTGGGGSPTFTTQVTGGDTWLTVTPARPIAPTQLVLAIKPAALEPGRYDAVITATGTGTAKGAAVINVSLQVLAKGGATLNSVLNAAGYQSGGILPARW